MPELRATKVARGCLCAGRVTEREAPDEWTVTVGARTRFRSAALCAALLAAACSFPVPSCIFYSGQAHRRVRAFAALGVLL